MKSQGAVWRSPGGRPLECAFCEIARHDPHGQVIERVLGCVVIEPLEPVVEGHRLVIPCEHVEDALARPPITGRAMTAACLWAARGGWGACNVITSVGAEATQTVRHLHIHLVPRAAGDGLALPWSDGR